MAVRYGGKEEWKSGSRGGREEGRKCASKGEEKRRSSVWCGVI